MTKKLTSLSLALITVGSVDSVRNLPTAALVGSNLFLYFSLALLLFLLPCAAISIWFSNQADEGIYGWVKKSLGNNAGFTAIWFQWMQNIIIYPTFLSFIAGAFLYCINPKLVDDNKLLFIIINILIWCLTWINIKGFGLSHKLTVFCSFFGLLIPFILILLIGLIWFISHPQSIQQLPQSNQESWASLTAIILSFCGIEIAAVHTQDSQSGVFRNAIILSVIIIFVTMLFGSLTLAILLSPLQLNFISGIPELFQTFFAQINCEKLSFVINGLIVIGCIGCANSWLNAPIKGLLFASKEFSKLNRKDSKKTATKLLLLQASGISLISTLFLFLPSINSSYWIMITLATQMYLLMYSLMFLGAIRLSWIRRTQSSQLITLIAMTGLIGISIAFLVSFNLPSTIQYSSQLHYSLFLAVCLLLMTVASKMGKKIF